MEIVEYESGHQRWFEQLNRQWIEQYFWIEPVDEEVLQYPEKNILEKGGAILMATSNGEVAGTVALKRVDSEMFEFTKMAVDEKYRGQKIGRALGQAAIKKAKELGAKKIILYSNTVLAPAIELYRKLGFAEVPVDGPYKRSNIKMELNL
jgi:GNAT superfamily N-acetyltransferase